MANQRFPYRFTCKHMDNKKAMHLSNAIFFLVNKKKLICSGFRNYLVGGSNADVFST